MLPVRFSFLPSLSFHLIELRQQLALVIDLMHMGRSEIHQRLMGPLVMISLDIPADLFSGRDLIGIIPHQINLLLLDRPVEPLGQCVVGRTTDPGKRITPLPRLQKTPG